MSSALLTRSIIVVLLGLVLIPHANAQERLEQRVLWELRIEGNQALSDTEIRESIATQASSHFVVLGKYLFGAGRQAFDPVAFQADIKRVERLYRRLGYFQARVDGSGVYPCSAGGRVCAYLRITEGGPTQISGLEITVSKSNPERTPGELAEVFGLRTGAVFKHDEYLRAKETVLAYLRERSYPAPKIEGKALYDARTNTIGLTLKVEPGTAAELGYITFQGLERVRPEDVANRLPLQTGMRFDPRLFEDAQDLLGDLDLFRSLDVDLLPRAQSPSIVDVVYKVREKPLKTLQFGAGARIENSRQEARLRAEWINRNFYNHLRVFNARLEPRFAVLPSVFRPQQSGPLGNLDLTMRQPAFLSPRQDLRTSIGFTSDLEQGYRWYGPHLSGNIDRRLTRRLTASFGYSFRYLSFYDVDLGRSMAEAGAIPLELLFTDDYRLGFLDQRLRWDSRDEIVEPRRGILAQLAISESARFLASEFTYLKVVPEIRYYVPMTRRATLATRALFGRMLPLKGDASPITERFYGGGASAHRGFTYHRLSPQTLSSDGRSVPVGGNVELLLSAEERINLFRLGGYWLIGALFVDAGDVVSAPAELDLRQLHVAIGPGIRYSSPLGVIRADVGFRVNRLGERTGLRENPDPGDRFAVHVSFGEAF